MTGALWSDDGITGAACPAAGTVVKGSDGCPAGCGGIEGSGLSDGGGLRGFLSSITSRSTACFTLLLFRVTSPVVLPNLQATSSGGWPSIAVSQNSCHC